MNRREDPIDEIDGMAQPNVFPDRSRAVQKTIEEESARSRRSRLSQECAKLDPMFEQTLADEDLNQMVGD